MEILSKELSLQEKLELLADAAKYDVSCTSSGSDRRGKSGSLGNSCAAGICHSFAADGRCISLLKILLSNDCVYDCKYCINRASNDRPRATFTPDEICLLTVEFYRRNMIEGLFLSSAVCRNPTFTMELMYQTLFTLRKRYHFNGYLHVKAIPGAPPELVEKIGYLADRMSINLELPTREGLRTLAPHKTQSSLLKPMRQIQQGIADYRITTGKSALMERSSGNRYLSHTIFDHPKKLTSSAADPALSAASDASLFPSPRERTEPFVPAGQSTQMIIGATDETDFQLLSTSQVLYQKFDLKRVFYSAYIPLNEDAALPDLSTPPPLLREHRLYQADWLLRYYGFHAEELLDEEHPNFLLSMDPKCDWALRHPEYFPVEINTADYDLLLRVPGIGPKSAMRILNSRRYSHLTFEHIRKIGVVLKRARFFITCGGKAMEGIRLEQNALARQLMEEESGSCWEISHGKTYHQLSLFDDFHLEGGSLQTEILPAGKESL